MNRIRQARVDDAAAIVAIYNQGIEERQATFETEPRSVGDIVGRIRDGERHPLLVACNDDGDVVGWAGVAPYRSRACYDGVGEFSVYLDRKARSNGIGRALMEALIGATRMRGYWKLVSRIFPANRASRALCQSCGFREVGTYRSHARLDGRFEDVVIVERLIPENLTEAEAPTRTVTAIEES